MKSAGIAGAAIVFAVLVYVATLFGGTRIGFMESAVLFAAVSWISLEIVTRAPKNLRRVWLCATLFSLCALAEVYLLAFAVMKWPS